MYYKFPKQAFSYLNFVSKGLSHACVMYLPCDILYVILCLEFICAVIFNDLLHQHKNNLLFLVITMAAFLCTTLKDQKQRSLRHSRILLHIDATERSQKKYFLEVLNLNHKHNADNIFFQICAGATDSSSTVVKLWVIY
ncbi:hypothetical protein VP01_1609g13 [Puccinia sorghi]|uniref:Uncharacterized protein n=1 Tax=Puccinia sorghi TaxID=27349 RepID=A0A0L6VHC0_9BASI|nr:hypothetical protein VP01_1609g13 [Puccinia sorghi]